MYEIRYLLAIAILSTLYTGGQCYRQFHQAYAGKDLLPLKTAALIDFVGDQVSFSSLSYSIQKLFHILYLCIRNCPLLVGLRNAYICTE